MRTLLIGGLLVAAAAPALAQSEKAPFTGPHIEALAGYDALGSGKNFNASSKDGLMYGVNAGYDFQIGGAVLGLEGEYADSTTRARGNSINVAGDSGRLDADRDLYAGARIGFAVRPSTLIYAKGGYTNLRLKSTYTNGATTTIDHATLDGYRLGAGIEQKFNLFGPSGFVKAEYRYSNYGNANVGAANLGVDVDRHQVVAGVGVRF